MEHHWAHREFNPSTRFAIASELNGSGTDILWKQNAAILLA
jgi:hypothetical protein